MICPNCDEHVTIQDWHTDEPFECEFCNCKLMLDTDEGGYRGAARKYLVVVDSKDDADYYL